MSLHPGVVAARTQASGSGTAGDAPVVLLACEQSPRLRAARARGVKVKLRAAGSSVRNAHRVMTTGDAVSANNDCVDEIVPSDNLGALMRLISRPTAAGPPRSVILVSRAGGKRPESLKGSGLFDSRQHSQRLSQIMDPANPASFNHRTELLSTGRRYHFVDQLPTNYDPATTTTIVCIHGFPDLWSVPFPVLPWGDTHARAGTGGATRSSRG